MSGSGTRTNWLVPQLGDNPHGESPKPKFFAFPCSIRRTLLAIVIEWVGDSITSMSTISWSASKQNVGKDEVLRVGLRSNHLQVAALGSKKNQANWKDDYSGKLDRAKWTGPDLQSLMEGLFREMVKTGECWPFI